jgi:hypothetical protein
MSGSVIRLPCLSKYFLFVFLPVIIIGFVSPLNLPFIDSSVPASFDKQVITTKLVITMLIVAIAKIAVLVLWPI